MKILLKNSKRKMQQKHPYLGERKKGSSNHRSIHLDMLMYNINGLFSFSLACKMRWVQIANI